MHSRSESTTVGSVIWIALFTLMVLGGCSPVEGPPRAINGYMDLSQWDFEKDGIVELKGQWEIYWHKLLSPDDFSTIVPPDKTGYFPVPKKWDGKVVDGVRLSHQGHATLKLKVRLSAGGLPLVFQIDTGKGARKIWLDGELLTEVGEMGTNAESVRGSVGAPVVYHVHQGDQVREFVVQIANYSYHHLFTSFFRIYIGKYDDFRSRNTFYAGLEVFILGALFFMGLYHAILYLFRRIDLSDLYFSAVCLLYGTWSAGNGLGYRYSKTILMNGETWLNVAFVTDLLFYPLVPAFVMYVHSIFPRECSRVAVRISQVAGLSWFAAKILVHFSYDVRAFEVLFRVMYHPTWRPFLLIFVALVIYIIAIVVVAAVRKEPNAYFMLASLMLLLACGVYDILQVTYLLSNARMLGIGFFGMIVCQSFILARRFSLSFFQVEQLSQQLEEKNIALSRMDKIKDEFLANTSHELRTPLNGIIGIAESLIKGAAGKLPQKAVVNISMIFSSSKRLAGLVSDILDFSKLKGRDIELAKKPVDIKSLSNLVFSVCRGLIGNKPLELVNDIPADIPFVQGDENRLQQIFYNLIGNAIKFTDQGEVRVAAEQVDSMVRVSVSDTGIGIPADQFETIFKSFEQGDSDSSRTYGGTGLGLSITRHLVELHDGKISLESEIGKGSTFYFTLPMSNGQPAKDSLPTVSRVVNGTASEEDFQFPETARPHPAVTYPESSAHESYEVLVVDDDRVNLQVVANHLSLENISFQTAPDGTAALERIESGERPRVLLLDIMMPKITGYEVCRKLRETYSLSELPIIMLTAKNHLADLVEAYKAGASDYLSKPFSKDELISRVRCHLDLRAAFANILEKRKLEKEVLEQKQKKEMARIQAEKENLEKLRYQLNPHFLFNALASIRGAILRDKDVARELISHLAEFSRLALSRGSMDILTVAQELEIIRLYLEMEQIRFSDYLTVNYDIEPGTEDIKIPALVLQPLLENAVKYGSRTSPDVLAITISARMQPTDRLRLEISNSGQWVEPGTTESRYSTGTGIENIKKRLDRYYSEQFRFENRLEKGQVIIVIDLPREIGNGNGVLNHSD